jgi:hypothetical protein
MQIFFSLSTIMCTIYNKNMSSQSITHKKSISLPVVTSGCVLLALPPCC